MKIIKPIAIILFLLAGLIQPTQIFAAQKNPTEQDGLGLGLDMRTVETNWYHNNSGGATTHESFDLLGVKGEYQMSFLTVDQLDLDFSIGGTLFFTG